jgi:hypothetical protein
VEIRDGDKDFGWGVVVAYNKVINPRVRETQGVSRTCTDVA